MKNIGEVLVRKAKSFTHQPTVTPILGTIGKMTNFCGSWIVSQLLAPHLRYPGEFGHSKFKRNTAQP